MAELTEILKGRSLPHSGKKADLIARLNEADKAAEASEGMRDSNDFSITETPRQTTQLSNPTRLLTHPSTVAPAPAPTPAPVPTSEPAVEAPAVAAEAQASKRSREAPPKAQVPGEPQIV